MDFDRPSFAALYEHLRWGSSFRLSRHTRLYWSITRDTINTRLPSLIFLQWKVMRICCGTSSLVDRQPTTDCATARDTRLRSLRSRLYVIHIMGYDMTRDEAGGLSPENFQPWFYCHRYGRSTVINFIILNGNSGRTFRNKICHDRFTAPSADLISDQVSFE